VQVELRLPGERGRRLANLLTNDHSQADARGRHRIILEPYGYHWYRMGGLGYLLDRTDF
jgi:maltose alpha-D-glucosyltransferase/alpha-amylase